MDGDEVAHEMLRNAARRMRATKVAGILGIDPSHLSRVLTRGPERGRRQLSDEVRERILERWNSLGLDVAEVRRLEALWPAAARTVEYRNVYYVESSSVLFTALLLIAEEKRYFVSIDTPLTRIVVRWREEAPVPLVRPPQVRLDGPLGPEELRRLADELEQGANDQEGRQRLLGGKRIIERVLNGHAHFGLAHDRLLAEQTHVSHELTGIARLQRALEVRICIPRRTYEEVRAQKGNQPPLFGEIVEHVNKRDGVILVDPRSVGPKFVEWLAYKMDLLGRDDREKENLLAIQQDDFTHDDAVKSNWPDQHCIVITFPPLSFQGAYAPGHSFVELSELYYDFSNESPLCSRNVTRKKDIYRMYRGFSLASTIFAKTRTVKEHPEVCVAVFRGLQRTLRYLEHARQRYEEVERWQKDVLESQDGGEGRNHQRGHNVGTTELDECVNIVLPHFKEMLKLPIDMDHNLEQSFRTYLMEELRRIDPILEQLSEHTDPFFQSHDLDGACEAASEVEGVTALATADEQL